MRLRALLLLTPLLLFRGGHAQDLGEISPRRPNVLLISIDTLRADHVGFMGYERETTPNLDKLADRAVVFTKAISQSSWTSPSVASFLTGHYPIRHGMMGGPLKLNDEVEMLAEMLSKAGYRTGAGVQNAWLATIFGWNRGFEDFAQFDFLENPLTTPKLQKEIADWFGRKDERPFFCWLHYFAPHAPYVPKEPWIDEWTPKKYSKWFESVEYIEMKRFKDRLLLPNDRQRFLALYDSEIRFADESIGKVMLSLAASGHAENTIVVFVSDHGEEFKEHASLGHYRTLHPELVHVPFMISLPGQKKRVDFTAMVATADLVPTLRSILSLPEKEYDGKRLLHAAEEKVAEAVDSSVGRFTVARTGEYICSFRYASTYAAGAVRGLQGGKVDTHLLRPQTGGYPHLFSIRDKDWHLTVHSAELDLEKSQAIDRTHPDAEEVPFLTRGRLYEYFLYDLNDDPTEQMDVAKENPKVCLRLARALREIFREKKNRIPMETDGTIHLGSEIPMPDATRDALRGLGYLK